LAQAIWFGDMFESSLHLSMVCALLCVAYWLVYVWCALGRIQADLLDELSTSKLEQAKDECKNEQPDCETSQPNCQSNESFRLHVKLRRKAFLVRRNANKVDQLLFYPLRLILGFLRKKYQQGSHLFGNVSRRSCGIVFQFTKQFAHLVKNSLGFGTHKSGESPNDKLTDRRELTNETKTPRHNTTA